MCRFRADWNPEKGTMCYDGFKLGCPIGAMEFDNDPKFGSNKSHWYYEWNCTTCSCLEEAPQAPQAQPGIPYLVVLVTVAAVLAGVALCAYFARDYSVTSCSQPSIHTRTCCWMGGPSLAWTLGRSRS